HLDPESRAHFDTLRSLLDAAGVEYRVNPRLVRGLDYYTRTVFEWLTDRLGAQSAVCAGGRYDQLVAMLGGAPTPAIGFAIGLERAVELLAQSAQVPDDGPQIYLAPTAAQTATALSLAEALRDRGLRAECHFGGSLKSQLKRADRSGARYALLIEAPTQAVVKDLRGDEGQRTVPTEAVVAHLVERLGSA